MRTIDPGGREWRAWSKLPPVDGDLVFAKKRGTLERLAKAGFLVLTAEELRSHPLWSLSHRSWYQYALGRSLGAAYLPRGALESLPRALLSALFDEQVVVGNGAVLPSPRIGLHRDGKTWVTSAFWNRLDVREKLFWTKHWYDTHRSSHAYPRHADSVLSPEARESLATAGLCANHFAETSGPNCLAAAAALAGGAGVHRLWLHPEPFTRYLRGRGFKKGKGEGAAGDILLVLRERVIVHAAFVIDDRWLFEKPGQDFYEPYRLLPIHEFSGEWPKTKIEVWRKGPSRDG